MGTFKSGRALPPELISGAGGPFRGTCGNISKHRPRSARTPLNNAGPVADGGGLPANPAKTAGASPGMSLNTGPGALAQLRQNRVFAEADKQKTAVRFFDLGNKQRL